MFSFPDMPSKPIKRPQPVRGSLQDMQLHDQFQISSILSILRVPGGWIYRFNDDPTSSVYVPYSSAFDDVAVG